MPVVKVWPVPVVKVRPVPVVIVAIFSLLNLHVNHTLRGRFAFYV